MSKQDHDFNCTTARGPIARLECEGLVYKAGLPHVQASCQPFGHWGGHFSSWRFLFRSCRTSGPVKISTLPASCHRKLRSHCEGSAGELKSPVHSCTVAYEDAYAPTLNHDCCSQTESRYMSVYMSLARSGIQQCGQHLPFAKLHRLRPATSGAPSVPLRSGELVPVRQT